MKLTIYVVQYKSVNGSWVDHSKFDHFNEANDWACTHWEFDKTKVRVVERVTRDTVCLGWRQGDKAMTDTSHTPV